MAILTATGAQAAVQPKGLRVGLVAVRSVFSINVSLSAGDVIQMVKVPANATPVFLQWGGNPKSAFYSIVEVGDGIVTGRYRSLATYSQAQAMLFATIPVTPYLYSADDTIDIGMPTVETIQSPGGAFYMNVIFSMDVNSS